MDAEIARNVSEKCLGGRPVPRSLEVLWEHRDEVRELFAIELLADVTWFDDWVDPNDPDNANVRAYSGHRHSFCRIWTTCAAGSTAISAASRHDDSR